MGNDNNSKTKTHKHGSKDHYVLLSPNGRFSLDVNAKENAPITYSLKRDDVDVVHSSNLHLYDTDNNNLLEPKNSVGHNTTSFDETWEQVWGEQRYVRNHYNELSIETDSFTVRFRLFDDSLGFRYELSGEGSLDILKEETEFNVPSGSSAWWIPALGQNHYEHLYKKTGINDIDAAHTPLTLDVPEGGFITIHEAALYDYGAMNLVPTGHGLVSTITPLEDGVAARVSLPFSTPWRTVAYSDTAIGLGNSKTMLNLNEPSKIADTSWIKPTKFMGIWWGMFTGKYTWASGDKHGATTPNAFKYINAAKKLGISALLIEGWNETWDGNWMENGDIINLMQPYPDFDIHAITSYAKSQGVDIIGHHETSGHKTRYESQLPEAYDYYRHFGVRYIKTGYVSPRLDTGDFHSSQVGVKHFQMTVEMAAERKIMLDIHEPVKGTGIERTWPNLMTREGVMGQEYEGGAVTPEHATVLPFTRLLAGPLDYTPGLFNLSGTSRKVSSTLAKQLAFYVTMFSPMQMAADLPEHYENHPAFQFIKDVPVNWDKTIPLEGEIGEYYIVARKDRHSDNWYVGGVSDENERQVTVNLDFLQEHRSYEATIYCDAEDSHWENNREAHEIKSEAVSHGSFLSIRMAPGGGFAIAIHPKGEIPRPYPA